MSENDFTIVDTDEEKETEEYEKYCSICNRPESVTGKMIELPNNLNVC